MSDAAAAAPAPTTDVATGPEGVLPAGMPGNGHVNGKAANDNTEAKPVDAVAKAAKELSPKEARPETEAQKAFRLRRNIKVGGKEQTLDLSEEDAALEIARHRANQHKYQEANTKAQQAEALLQALQQNPFAVLEHLGIDVNQHAQQLQQRRQQLEQLSEPERMVLQLQQEKQALEQQVQAHRQQQEQLAQQQELQKATAEVIGTVKAAMEKAAIPKTYTNTHIYAQVMRDALDEGLELTPEQVAAEFRHRKTEMVEHDLGEHVQAGAYEEIARMLGPTGLKGLLQYTLRAHQGAQAALAKPAANTNVEKKEEPRRILRDSDIARMRGI